MRRFLSELWSSSPKKAKHCPHGDPAQGRIRSLPSRLLSPSSSNSDSEGAVENNNSHILHRSGVATPRALPTCSAGGAKTCNLKKNICATERHHDHGAAMGLEHHMAPPTSAQNPVQQRRSTAWKSRARPCRLQVHRSSGHATSKPNEPVPDPKVKLPSWDPDPLLCLGLLLDSAVTVGKRTYKLPDDGFWDSCPLATFQLDELSSYKHVKVRLTPQSDRSFHYILQHCCKEIQHMISDFGSTVCVFKIGISSNIEYRVCQYRKAHFNEMRLLHNSNTARFVELLEVLLIAYFQDRPGCRNRAKGGDGSMALRDPYGPYFVYCVAARADGNKLIGT